MLYILYLNVKKKFQGSMCPGYPNSVILRVIILGQMQQKIFYWSCSDQVSTFFSGGIFLKAKTNKQKNSDFQTSSSFSSKLKSVHCSWQLAESGFEKTKEAPVECYARSRGASYKLSLQMFMISCQSYLDWECFVCTQQALLVIFLVLHLL